MEGKKPVIVALDLDSLEEAGIWVDRLKGLVWGFKVGSQLFCRYGPLSVREIKGRGTNVFLDLKFHDIPNTVSKATAAAVAMGADLVDIHAQGGAEMIRAARHAAQQESARKGVSEPKILAVTVLTSLEERDLYRVGIRLSPLQWVLRLSEVAIEAGAHGVIASPWEIEPLRRRFGRDPLIVVPGIRPADAETDDQKRVMGPKEALQRGADYIVMGRGLLKAADPVDVLCGIE